MGEPGERKFKIIKILLIILFSLSLIISLIVLIPTAGDLSLNRHSKTKPEKKDDLEIEGKFI